MNQAVRKQARRAALEVQARRLRERAEVEQRCSGLGVDVAVALSERNDAIERHELAAGRALVALTRTEHLTLAEACRWAGDLSVAEAKRLRQLAEKDATTPAGGDQHG